MATGSPPQPRMPAPPVTYHQGEEAHFRADLERYLRELATYIQKAVVQTPTVLAAGDSDDYDPGRRGTTLRLEADSTGSALTGISRGVDGRLLRIVNIAAAGDLTLRHANAGSVAANQLKCIGAVDIALAADEYAEFEYDATTQLWRMTFTNADVVSTTATMTTAAIVNIHGPNQAPYDDGADLNYHVQWNWNDATPSTHRVTLAVFVDGLQEDSKTVDLDTPQPYEYTLVGGGNLTGTHNAKVTAQLRKVSDSLLTGTAASSATLDFLGINP